MGTDHGLELTRPTSIVTTWLGQHPEDLNYNAQPKIAKLKTSKRRYNVLLEIQNDAMSHGPRDKTRGSLAQRGRKRLKRVRDAFEPGDSALDNADSIGVSHQASIPSLRPRRHTREAAPDEPHAKEDDDDLIATSTALLGTGEQWPEQALPFTAPQQASRYDVSPSRSGIGSSTSTSQRTRARSSVKTVGDLALSSMPSIIREFGDPKYPIPDVIKSLCQDLRRIHHSKKVVPRAIEAEIMQYLTELGYEEAPCAEDAESFDETLVLQKVVELHEAARDCSTQQDPESAWNAEVHSRILRLALAPGRVEKGVFYRDISSASISDSSLLPATGTGPCQTVMGGKMVDYAIVIEPDGSLESRIWDTLVQEGRRSINQTDAENVRFTPIAISIETKRPGVGGDDADIQTLMWIIAQYRRFMQLGVYPLPVLPHIIVQGHQWKMRIAEMKPDGMIVALGSIPLGQTTDVLGIFQIIASLRRLARWVDEDYRQVFEAVLLPF